jgi:hypothetical protein
MILPEIREFSIPIYVSDDSTSNETRNMLDEMQKTYENIFYFRNTPSLGHDRNILHALNFPSTDYIWLLGDSLFLKKGAIKSVLEIIAEGQPERIAVNSDYRALDGDCHYFDDCNEVFNTFAWHLTMTGVTIYSKNAISTIDQSFQKEFKNFPQIALIFNYLSKECSFYWINKKCTSLNPDKKSYWEDDLFSVFLIDWSSVIRHLPNCYDNKSKVIVEHSLRANVFSLKSLLLARSKGVYNINIFKKYKSELPAHSGLSAFTLLLISIFPRVILKIVIIFRQFFK